LESSLDWLLTGRFNCLTTHSLAERARQVNQELKLIL
jgi:hypothetical protein